MAINFEGMKAKVLATGEFVSVTKGWGSYEGCMCYGYWTKGGRVYSKNELEFVTAHRPKKVPKEVTIEGYVARDKDGIIRLHYTEPSRQSDCYWQGDYKSSYLPDSILPEVTWDSEPKKVKITIIPMD